MINFQCPAFYFLYSVVYFFFCSFIISLVCFGCLVCKYWWYLVRAFFKCCLTIKVTYYYIITFRTKLCIIIIYFTISISIK